MDKLKDLFATELIVANLGSGVFSDAIRAQAGSSFQVEWEIPCRGDEKLFSALEHLRSREISTGEGSLRIRDFMEQANTRAVEILNESHPYIVGVGKAIDDIPGMADNLILHAGPPVTWDKMCGPMKGAVMGALIYEGFAKSEKEAASLAASGSICFEPCHHHATVGPMAGVVSPSMPVWIIENKTHGRKAYCTLNEGLGKVLRYGAFSDEVITRLKWMEAKLAPLLRETIEISSEIDLRTLIAQALQMGDEGHNRNRAGTSLLIRELAPSIVRSKASEADKAAVLSFMHSNDHFFLNLTMPAGKSCLDAIAGIEGCTVLTAMARNGTEFGVRVSMLGDRWFTAPAPKVDGLYLGGFTEKDANPDIGDSTICETYGIGGFAMAAAPAIVEFVGGSPADALRFTLNMYEISAGESTSFRIPALGFRGTPSGIDVVKVVEKGILPAVNTGIAHKDPGVGQVGAGLVEPPMSVFEDAFEAVFEHFKMKEES